MKQLSSKCRLPHYLISYYKDNGFSLIELLVAMFILTLIVFAFTPLLVSSFERIRYAGDKSEALYVGQSDLEVEIATRFTEEGVNLIVEGGTLIFEFGELGESPETRIEVQGLFLDVEKSIGEASAWLSAFVPTIPSISVRPSLVIEGYPVTDIALLGNDTKFTEVTDGVYIYDRNSFFLMQQTIIPDGESDDLDLNAYFTLTGGLKNSDTPHIVGLSWSEGDITFTVYARLDVALPQAVAVGSGQRIWISPDVDVNWSLRGQLGSTGIFNDIIWTGFEYIAVSDSGRIAVWRDGQPPALSSDSYGGLNSIAYDGLKYVAVGNNGNVITSINANQWNTVSLGAADNLRTVRWGDTATGGEFVTVGMSGAYFSSPDGEIWVKKEIEDAAGVNFHGAAYNNDYWLVVGGDSSGKAVFYKSKSNNDSNDSWDYVLTGSNEDELNAILKDVIFDGNQFIAVGENGTIVSSSDGESWDKYTIGNKNLNAIDWGEIGEQRKYLIVGAAETFIISTNGTDWSVLRSVDGSTINSMGAAIRWLR